MAVPGYAWLKSAQNVPVLGLLFRALFLPAYGPGYFAYFGAAEWFGYTKEWPFVLTNAVYLSAVVFGVLALMDRRRRRRAIEQPPE